MSKNEYREFFAKCKPFIKYKYFCKIAGVSPVSLSRFLKGSEWDYEMSLDKCYSLYSAICQALENIA